MAGHVWVCCASGESMKKEDIELARSLGARVLVINTTFRLCPDADALFAMDWGWWRDHAEEVRKGFKGMTYTASDFAAKRFGITRIRRSANNSGSQAIVLAERFGASAVVLLGYDGKGGHWHPPHKRAQNPHSNTLHRREHRRIAGLVKVPVYNCSPGTAVEAFPVAPLKETLCKLL